MFKQKYLEVAQVCTGYLSGINYILACRQHHDNHMPNLGSKGSNTGLLEQPREATVLEKF